MTAFAQGRRLLITPERTLDRAQITGRWIRGRVVEVRP